MGVIGLLIVNATNRGPRAAINETAFKPVAAVGDQKPHGVIQAAGQRTSTSPYAQFAPRRVRTADPVSRISRTSVQSDQFVT
jgi:hypothetical protein